MVEIWMYAQLIEAPLTESHSATPVHEVTILTVAVLCTEKNVKDFTTNCRAWTTYVAESVEHQASIRNYIEIIGARRKARGVERCRFPDELRTSTDEDLTKRFRQPR